MRNALVVSLPPSLAVAFAWTRLESGPGDWRLAVAVVLGLAAVALTTWAQRVAALLVGLVLTASLGFSAWPGGDGAWPGDVLAGAEKGLRDFYTVALPFDSSAHDAMQGLVLVVVFALTGALVLASAWGRPLACSAVAAVGVCWPATIVPGRDTVAIGALALGAALWPPLAARVRAGRGLAPALVTLIAVVAFASAAAGAGLQPSESAVAWQRWTLFDDSSRAAGVKLVWDASYAGIEFPARRTTVLRIRAPRRSLYWRASTLDRFTADRWIEDLYPVDIAGARRLLPQNPLQPPGARSAAGWVEQRVEVAALVDDHIVGAVEPMRVESDDLERVVYLSGGVMRSASGLTKGQSYTVWSAAARPTPAQLVRSPARYPAEARRYLELGRTVLPAFGAAGRTAHVETLFDDVRYQPLWAYRGVWKRALTVAGKAKTPYQATIAIERWLRSQGGFRYEERPPQAVALPPLADFVLRTKEGYCQHFAGAMALMLRMLGVPARVAVGFTSGTWRDGVWRVTDHDAHAWVEVWLAGHGWLTFDPTPGRGRLSAAYTNASDSADAVQALGTGRFLDFSAPGLSDGGVGAAIAGTRRSAPVAVALSGSVAGVAVLLGGLALAKGWRRRRRLRRQTIRGGGRRLSAPSSRASCATRASCSDATRAWGRCDASSTAWASARTPSQRRSRGPATGRRRVPRRPRRTHDASSPPSCALCGSASARVAACAASSPCDRSAPLDDSGTMRA